jgi:hypothetical protein
VVLVKCTGGGKTLPVLVSAMVVNDVPLPQMKKTILYIAPTKVIINMIVDLALSLRLEVGVIIKETSPNDRTLVKNRLCARQLNLCTALGLASSFRAYT